MTKAELDTFNSFAFIKLSIVYEIIVHITCNMFFFSESVLELTPCGYRHMNFWVALGALWDTKFILLIVKNLELMTIMIFTVPQKVYFRS